MSASASVRGRNPSRKRDRRDSQDDERSGLGGPVSAAVEADLRTWVRRHGVVIWLDVDDHYSGLVDKLAQARARKALPYDVFGFRGSHLELALALESMAGSTTKKPLVVHLPGFNEQTVKETPLLELYLAGTRYRKALDTAVTEAAAGRVRPEQIEAFKAEGKPSLARADAWLQAQLDDTGDGFAAHLNLMTLTRLLDDLLGGEGVAREVASEEHRGLVWDRLATLSGMPDAWRDDVLQSGSDATAKDMAFVVAGWALVVEYVDDLQRSPVNPRIGPAEDLPRGVVDACRDLAAHMRERHADFYQRTADETEALLEDEIEKARAEDLGRIDTFRFEEKKVLNDALEALRQARWNEAAEWASVRLNGGSFWLKDDLERSSAWELVRDAATLGKAIVAAGLSLGAKDLAGAVARYASVGARVDQAHRRLEQRRLALLGPRMPEFETLRSRLDAMREAWRCWADAWARDFNALCRAEGFLPAAELQQRNLFEEVVRPLCQEQGTTAYFVVDAFRFEMAEELFQDLSSTPAANVRLDARLAELPTVTEVGMNVLAPVVHEGRLRPAMSDGKVKGFSTGQFRVHDPDTRRRAKHERIGGATCPWLSLADVVSRDSTSLKQAVARAKLLVVHSEEIDKAGESGVGLHSFDTIMRQLRAAWRLLRDAGVRRFVFTADHGFLLLDDRARVAQPHGRKIDPKRRHVFSEVAADHTGEARVPLADLRYEGVSGHVMFPETTAVFDRGRRPMSFVHGGNSLQERVIPVLTVVHRAAAGASTIQYAITATALDGVAGLHCIKGRVEIAAQATLDFGGSKEVELALRVVDEEDVIVELCQTRGGARFDRSSLNATVGEDFEVFFRLTGSSEARAIVEVYHPSAVADVVPCPVDGRFAITATRAAVAPSPVPARAPRLTPRPDPREWLEKLPEGETRQVFEHLAAHGAVTESEAAGMLGSQRALRRFARQFEELAAFAPFAIRIQVVAGVKRYVREGSNS